MSVQLLTDFVIRHQTVQLYSEGFAPAHMNPSETTPWEEEGLRQYFDHEFRMQTDTIRKRGYATMFLVAPGVWVLHVRITFSLGQFEVHRLD